MSNYKLILAEKTNYDTYLFQYGDYRKRLNLSNLRLVQPLLLNPGKVFTAADLLPEEEFILKTAFGYQKVIDREYFRSCVNRIKDLADWVESERRGDTPENEILLAYREELTFIKNLLKKVVYGSENKPVPFQDSAFLRLHNLFNGTRQRFFQGISDCPEAAEHFEKYLVLRHTGSSYTGNIQFEV